MNCKPTRMDAYRLLHEGTRAFADMEERGIRIDRSYCQEQMQSLAEEASTLKRKLLNEPDIKRWKSLRGTKFNMDSDDQLGKFLFGTLKHKASKQTKSGKASTDKESLQGVDIPWVKKIARRKKVVHVRKVLEEIMREQVGGILHPFFNLNTARTYRSSSDHINFQNKDVRDKWAAETVRRAFIPRKGRCFLESDFKGIEVGVSACNNHDPVLIAYVTDKSKDMHRDQAMEIYVLKKDEVTKDTRYAAKNRFVFPEFYGSYWKKVAPALWKSIPELKLTTAAGVPLLEHLRQFKLVSYDRFERHIEKVEDRFWNKKFRVFTEWKEAFYSEYLRKGFFDTLTGFRCSGVMKKTQVINYPTQGPAFHCLLWSLIQANKAFKKMDDGPMIVGQIHDSTITDNIREKDAQEVIGIIREIACKQLPEHWPWIIVPMDLEFELSPTDQPWFLKEKVEYVFVDEA